ncbi:hypothetical protein L2E82_04339 [Cichorium intybus]|uniref:Uncharacterized protein n=1 Tax=Cichorium intybus TaxID=13427 RepID=A0ACB9H4Z4_CICIN|nr:hypothetical protein L2E82_04339 [Cichorium intybus]
MKFSKSLSNQIEQTLPEWRDKFLSYKELKKRLKLINPQQKSGYVCNRAAKRPRVSLRQCCRRLNEKEIEKFNLFFVEKEEEYIIKSKFFRKPPWKEEPVLASLLIMQLQAYELTGLISPLIFKGFIKLEKAQQLEWKNRLYSLLLNTPKNSCSSTDHLHHWRLFFRSCLDENEAFLTTADSAIGLLPESTKSIPGWNGIEYKAAFPMQKPAGASFYPPDTDKMILRVDRKKRGFGMKPPRVALIHEIKQLKTLRDELATNMGSQDEAQQAMLEKYPNRGTYEGMLTLRKELEVLKNEVTKAEAATSVVGKKYDEISKRERELQAQFRTADYMSGSFLSIIASYSYFPIKPDTPERLNELGRLLN